MQVVNKKTHVPTDKDFYIGRPSVLGNPYSHLPNTLAQYKVETREEAIKQYRIWLKFQISCGNKEVLDELSKITEDSILVCWCKPQSCHGDEIVKVLHEVNFLKGYKMKDRSTSKYYAGIGSRTTPENVQYLMACIAKWSQGRGMILRSGGAQGADQAFERGVSDPAMKEIYLPWKGFEGNTSPLYTTPPGAYEIAARFHPAWDRCSQGAKNMHARNVCQVLGKDLLTPSKYVVCWTPEGSGSGGTGQAIRIARGYDIPVFDLGKQDVFDRLSKQIKE